MKKPLIVLLIVIFILLICTAVVGILATLGVVGVQATQKTYRETVRLNDLREVARSLEDYYTMYRAYPRLSNASGLKSLEQVTVKNDLKLVSQTISYLDPTSGLSTGISTLVTSPGVQVYTGSDANQSITCVSSGKSSGTTLVSSSEVWQIYYLALGDNPQNYKLKACTENGLTVNFGTLK